jgi:hypothetical protein
MESEQLRGLVRHDDQADAGLEPGQHRLGDELRDEAEAKRRGEQQDDAHEHGQRRGNGGHLRR